MRIKKILIEKYISKDAKILDLGCGAGRTTINLYRLGYKNIIGLDYSEKLIESANEYCDNNNLDIKFVYGDATNLSMYEDKTFDFILFSYNGLISIPLNDNSVLFAHYSSVNEIKEFITNNNFKLIENKLRSEICNESERITNWSKEDTMFYVVKK